MPDYFRAADVRGLVASTPAYRAERLLKEAKNTVDRYDVFLSHSVRDAQLIYGVRQMLVNSGLSVYVDWIDDPQLDRNHVTPGTAALLCSRMQRCRTLIYVSTRAATTSRWMPWELGYFDGMRGRDRVLLLPIEDAGSGQFEGAEYLGLYPTITRSSLRSPLVASPGTSRPPWSLGVYVRTRGW